MKLADVSIKRPVFATMMILVIISVSIIDFFCGKLRNRFT